MVQTLVEGATSAKRKVVVAGEMLELGTEAAAIHSDTGLQIAASGIDTLIGVRGLARHMVESARTKGLASTYVGDSEAAASLVVDTIKSGDVVLVKGSRGVRTEKVVEKLLETFELEEKSTATTHSGR